MALFYNYLQIANDFLWEYIAISIILFMGTYLTIKSRFFQFRTLFSPRKTIIESIKSTDKQGHGTHPLKLYFASVGGMIGLGNIVFVMGTVAIGGPGSLVWLWIASIVGMLMKYSEIFLGIKYRVKSKHGYNGGPMYYLQTAFKNRVLPLVVAFLLCIYGVEVFQFHVIVSSVSETFGIAKIICVLILLVLVMLSSLGGVKRLANISTIIMPPFMLIYIILALYIIIDNYALMPGVLAVVFKSAFTGYAPVGAFAGSSLIAAAHFGASRAVYSGDIGIGYDSIVQSETKVQDPVKHAKLAIFTLFTDTFICTLSILIVLLTGVWNLGLPHHQLVSQAISQYLPYVEVFLTILFFFAGFTTVIAFMVVGLKCSKFISPKYGKILYIAYALFAFIFFAFQDQKYVVLIMEFSGGLLMVINMAGVFKLRKEIKFD